MANSKEKTETLADIVAEMREIAQDPNCVAPTGLNYLADRIERAWEREREPNPCFYPDTDCQFRMMDGNCCSPCVRGGKPGNATARPVRNCDRFADSYEVLKAWDGGLESGSDVVRMLDWLYAPYEYRTPAPALDVVTANPEMKIAKEV